MAISLSTRSGSDLSAKPPSYFYFAYLPSSINEKDDKHCDGRGSDASDLCQQLNASLHTALDAARSGPDSFLDLNHRSDMEPHLWLLFLPLLASKSWGHEYYSGQCPEFPPMKNFVWEKVKFPDGWDSPNPQTPSLPPELGL